MNEAQRTITRLLRQLTCADAADRDAHLSRIVTLVYPELRRLAGRLMRNERAGHTLQPTALVHEAFLNLVDADIEWQGRAHFLGVAARAMRQVLVDHARRHQAGKRGAGVAHVTFDDMRGAAAPRLHDLLALDEALERLAKVDSRGARVVELRVFGGLTARETAEVLAVSKRTVDTDWSFARVWLARELR
jgi:RNA polymerase sigma factor (TIGR02999 family)